MPRLTTVITAGALTLIAAPAAAEVVERSADHFVLRYGVGLETTSEDIYGAIGDVSHWWAGSHTYSGSSANLSMPLVAGGCYCEALADGTTFDHGRVITADPETGVLQGSAYGFEGHAGCNRYINIIVPSEQRILPDKSEKRAVGYPMEDAGAAKALAQPR